MFVHLSEDELINQILTHKDRETRRPLLEELWRRYEKEVDENLRKLIGYAPEGYDKEYFLKEGRQLTAEKLLLSIDTYRRLGSFKRWLGIVTRSVVIDMAREATGRRHLFSIINPVEVEEVEKNLNKGIVSEKFRKIFEAKGFPPPEHATVNKKDQDQDEWEISNRKRIYIARKEYTQLNIYRQRIKEEPIASFKKLEAKEETDEETLSRLALEFKSNYYVDPESWYGDPAKWVEVEETKRVIESALAIHAQTDVKSAKAIRKRFWEKLTETQMQEFFGKTERTIYRWLHTNLVKLRIILALNFGITHISQILGGE